MAEIMESLTSARTMTLSYSGPMKPFRTSRNTELEVIVLKDRQYLISHTKLNRRKLCAVIVYPLSRASRSKPLTSSATYSSPELPVTLPVPITTSSNHAPWHPPKIPQNPPSSSRKFSLISPFLKPLYVRVRCPYTRRDDLANLPQPSTEALSLLAPTSAITLTSATPAPDDKDLARAEEFLSLRAVEVGRGALEEGRGKVREVEEARRRREESGNEAKKVVRKVSLEPETGWSGKGRMSGAWGM